jgi:anti-sigma factor RsiW
MAEINENDRAELVAYLDGELDEQASQAFEARMTRDRKLRAEAEALKKTWELLDYLPRAEPSPTFTNQTLERLAVRSTDKLGASKKRRWAWALPLGWAAAVLIALSGGLLVASFLWPTPNRANPTGSAADVEVQINMHRDVILNKHLYENGGSVQFLRELSQEFGDEED